ncbi:MAG TPA: hypothetical protein VM450_19805 [Thermomicrobiales bacterium]|nr:hypothetical protein [Thermomicrobiales bacterium]
MATESQVVLEDDWNYVAVVRQDGVARVEDGLMCRIEVGRGSQAPADSKATVLLLDEKAVRALSYALTATLEPLSGA